VSATILVSGMVAGTPGQAGASWAVLQYVLGFRRLGHDVHLVEPVATIKPASVAWCSEVMERFGLGACWALVATDGTTAGLSAGEVDRLVRRSDVLVNISGMLRAPASLASVPVRVYLDLDPAFIQLWHGVEGIDMNLDAHTHFVTVSDAVGGTIPDCGRTWFPTLPPVVLSEWPVAREPHRGAFTTIANWRGYGSIEHEGVHYGQKAHSVRSLYELPGRIGSPVVLALDIHPDEVSDLEALGRHGWNLADPAAAAGTIDRYRDFLRSSFAEIGIAKSGYVVSRSGWFSDRSACYLASGRPVIAQDTGFGRRLPVGAGLLSFDDVDGAALAAADVVGDYENHRRAARGIAEQHLDSDTVLSALLDRVT